jgi:hypothetical protein
MTEQAKFNPAPAKPAPPKQEDPEWIHLQRAYHLRGMVACICVVPEWKPRWYYQKERDARLYHHVIDRCSNCEGVRMRKVM